jgi:dTDP-4-amino-4,6-dideoxygalactose transaminase
MSFKELPLLKENKGTVLFYPIVPKSSFKEVKKVLSGRWIGQGPKVEYFEKIFKKMFCNKYNCLAVGSVTDALYLAYILMGLKKGDEVIAPVFTCAATNIPHKVTPRKALYICSLINSLIQFYKIIKFFQITIKKK